MPYVYSKVDHLLLFNIIGSDPGMLKSAQVLTNDRKMDKSSTTRVFFYLNRKHLDIRNFTVWFVYQMKQIVKIQRLSKSANFYNFLFIFQVSIQLNVIHSLQILWVVWQMGKTMCLAVKGTMFLMFVKTCVLESTQSKPMTFGHTCRVEPSLLQPWHASQRVLVSDVTFINLLICTLGLVL